MELVIAFLFVLAAVVAVPVIALVALRRTSSLARSVESLEMNVRSLRRRLDKLDTDSRRSGAGPADLAEADVPDTVAPAPAPRPVRSRARVAAPEEPAGADPAAEGPGAAPEEGEGPPAADAARPTPEAESPGAPQEPASQPSAAAPSAPGKDAIDIETAIGTTWVLRIGLGILAIALALFARTVAPMLSPAAKVAVAYSAAIALFAAGRFYENRLERFARPVMAGALSFGFFVAFAAHFVPAMRAIPLGASAIWMGFSMITVLVAAERWKSQSTAVLAFLLGHVSAYVAAGQADTYSLVILAALSLTAAVLLLRHEWLELGVAAVVLAYASHTLWILAERGPVGGDAAFWINLAFLSAYYTIFLIADVLWWRRRADREPDTSRAFADPRHIGPVNLVLYVSVTSFVYVTTDAHLGSIEWYYLMLGGLQGVLAWFYRHVHHRDYVFYPAFGTILWTLGMFAALDALSLNLVLAGQALLLLAAAHRTRLWIFHALAQVGLVVSFIHYWVFPRPPESTWPVFLGGLGIVAVYLVKAGLEEVWYAREEEFEWVEAGGGRSTTFAAAFRDLFRPIAPVLAPLHATLAALVLLREGWLHFGLTLDLAWTLALTGLVVTATVVIRRRTALLFTPTFLAGSAVLLAARMAGPPASLVLVSGFSLYVLVLVLALERRLSGPVGRSAHLHAQLGAVLALFGATVGAVSDDWTFAAGASWLLVPALVLLAQELGPTRPPAPEDEVDDQTAPDPALLLAWATGAVAVVILAVGAGMQAAAMIWVAGATALLMFAAGLRRSPRLLAAGYVLMALGYLYFLSGRADGTPLVYSVLEIVWLGVFVALVPTVVAIALDRAGSDGEWDPDEVDLGEGLVFAGYAIGFALIGTLAHVHLHSGSGWSKVAASLVGIGLIASSPRLRTPRIVPAVTAGLIVLHFLVLRAAARPESVEPSLLAIAIFGGLTLVAERLLGRVRPENREGGLDRFAGVLLVGLTAASLMAAAYRSTIIGPTWATAGWSVVGGLLMATGFGLASARHRRVALVVLAISLVRVFVVDTRELSDTAKIGAFLVLGLSLMGVAWLYAKYQERLRKWF